MNTKVSLFNILKLLPFLCVTAYAEDFDSYRKDLLESIATRPIASWETLTAERGKAPCSRREIFTNSEMLTYLAQAAVNAPQENRSVHGFEFRNESALLIELFEKLTTNVDYRQEERDRFQQHFKNAKQCPDVFCAAEEIFGKEQSVRLLFMLARFGFNGSHLTSKTFGAAAAWRADELDDILVAISAFPDEILPSLRNQRIVHDQRDNKYCRGYAAVGIKFCELWNSLEREKRILVVVHEIGHLLAQTTSATLDSVTEWKKIGGWREDPRYSHGLLKPETAVSQYAAETEYEDFAESVVYYRYSPKVLKKRSLEKYAYIRDHVFAGIEFNSEKTCQKPAAHQKIIEKDLIMAAPPAEAVSFARNWCGYEVMAALGRQGGAFLIAQDYALSRCLEHSLSAGVAISKAHKNKVSPLILSAMAGWNYPLAPTSWVNQALVVVAGELQQALEQTVAAASVLSSECDQWCAPDELGISGCSSQTKDFRKIFDRQSALQEFGLPAQETQIDYTMSGFHFRHAAVLEKALLASCKQTGFSQ